MAKPRFRVLLGLASVYHDLATRCCAAVAAQFLLASGNSAVGRFAAPGRSPPDPRPRESGLRNCYPKANDRRARRCIPSQCSIFFETFLELRDVLLCCRGSFNSPFKVHYFSLINASRVEQVQCTQIRRFVGILVFVARASQSTLTAYGFMWILLYFCHTLIHSLAVICA